MSYTITYFAVRILLSCSNVKDLTILYMNIYHENRSTIRYYKSHHEIHERENTKKPQITVSLKDINNDYNIIRYCLSEDY